MRFRLALSGVAVEARGEVRYCLPGVGIGLEFIALDPTTRKLIERTRGSPQLASLTN